MPTRKRSTSAAVYFWDRVSYAGITVGGIAVLAAVLGICVFLFWEVMPLFQGGHATPRPVVQLAPANLDTLQAPRRQRPVATILGEYNQAVATLDAQGAITATALDPAGNAQPFHHIALTGGQPITAAILTPHGPAALAAADGALHLGSIKLETELIGGDELTEPMKALAVGASLVADNKLVERTRESQWRATTLSSTIKRAELADGDAAGRPPIVALDLRDSGTGDRYMVAVRQDGTASFGTVTTVTPLGGDEPTETVSSTDFALATPARGPPAFLFVTADGNHILALWKDGTLERYAPQGDTVVLAEATTVLPNAGSAAQATQITAATMLLGGQTLIVGDDRGHIRAYHPARDPTSAAFDAVRLVQSDEASTSSDSPIASIAASNHDRVVAFVNEKGQGAIRHMTSHKTVATFNSAERTALTFSPKGDALLTASAAARQLWLVTPGHADASLKSLFGPVLYEGELEPQYIYQSSSGGEGAQVKMSLTPLIFGTLKATVVAMLIAIPLAVLAAIYTSEFMHKELRKAVKPTVELMASLPSVVLGFIAAMVVAPFMARWLPHVLLGIVLTPVFLGLFAHLWQLVPRERAHRINRRARMALIAVALLASVGLSLSLARPLESLLFAPTRTDVLLAQGSFEPHRRDQWPKWVGTRATMSPSDDRKLRQDGLAFRNGEVVKVKDEPIVAGANPAGEPSVRRWLDGSIGGPFPGWLLALLLPVMVTVFLAQGRLVPRERFEKILGATGPALAMAELIRYALTLVIGVAVSIVIAAFLTTLKLDPRDSIFGPYSQRNSLVVGVIMGFAVIPIIYTISEDALRAVPNHLRSASLGVGATPWQTAVRVVLPTAASGIFSAIMIGLGRAVGETMIVLMATGNTPEISANLFSGLRTLAANIAVELPEAARGDTHYRVLFLCGLVLFVLTFAINTTAEIVRQRFRKRNAAL
ncbi:MAG TPA: ABC transporter permease subunit [Phycisphaerales bacterium]|nr:ABC transporter permease subunit [Phycisphaerales bacterium]